MNRLTQERSPYLLQHAGNPVDWYPWGEEAFARARADDKPIFLSVGYSTCHWCHVMEHESFVSTDIAALLNRDFVSIKVDREERPDVDRVYMAFVQATTGAGGWPMTVFLTPALKPFYGGTYFPPQSRWGRPGFADLLRELARVWREERARVEEAAGELLERLRTVTTGDQPVRGSHVPGTEVLDAAVESFQKTFDIRRGGFGDAPKFPRPSELLFLLREHARQAAAGGSGRAPLLMVAETLRAMALGGMRDHIGGGFHRYSVDADWRVPHFEKMLYDQAQLVLACLETAQATADPFLAAVAEDTLAYLMRDMTDPAGGFCSAEDADSIPSEESAVPDAHKTEGAFYIWRDEEIAGLLGEDADIARRRYGIESAGNAPHDPHGEFAGRNLLYIAEDVGEIAARTGRDRAQVEETLERVRRALFAARAARPRPHRDDKVLTAWNGLAIAAFARAARVLPDSPHAGQYLDAAARAATFLQRTVWNPETGVLLRRYRDGEAGIPGYAEDYAYLVWGLLELVQADGDVRWLDWALALRAAQDERFWDDDEGGWFATSGADPAVLLRMKDDHDGAEPAAGSIAVLNLLTLAHLIPDAGALSRAERALARLAPRMTSAARAVPMMLCGLSAWHHGLGQVVVIGAPDGADTRALRRQLALRYLPFAVMLPVTPGEHQRALAARVDFIAGMQGDTGAAAYICRHFTCRQPVSDPAELAMALTT